MLHKKSPADAERSEALWADLSPFQGDRGGVAPGGSAKRGGEHSLLHKKSPADAELFLWSIGESNS